MKIFITGACGFIGSHLVEMLVKKNYKVKALTYYNPNNDIGCLKYINPKILDNLEIIQGDVRDNYFIKEASKGYDCIIHLAALIGIPYSYKSVSTYIETNINGTNNILNAVRENSIDKVVITSTSEVYGDPLVHPQTEDYWGNVNPIGPRACYDEGKRAAETLFFDYHRQHGLRIKVARLFNTYGPRMHPRDGRVVSNFVVSALSGTPLTVYGEGQQTRSFQYIDDLIEGLLALMHSPDEVTGPINLGNPGEFTIAELADLVIAQTGATGGIEYRPLPQDDPVRRQPDITKAKAILGWEPTIPLADGLERTIEYFRASLG